MGIYYDDDYDYEQHIKTVEDLHMVQPDRDIELFRVGATASVSCNLRWYYVFVVK